MIYAIKLKIELTILDQLTSMIKAELAQGNIRRGRKSLELQNRGFCSHSTPHGKFSIWCTIRVAKDAPVEADRIIQNQDENYKTHPIQASPQAGNLCYPHLSPESGCPSCTALVKDDTKRAESWATGIRSASWYFLHDVSN